MEAILDNDLKYWVALSTNLNIGARTFQKLASTFPSMQAVWEASDRDFGKHKIEPKIAKLVKETRNCKDPEEEIKKIENLGITAVTVNDKNYPPLLKEIFDPPALLYVKGELEADDDVSLAVVGSRKFTSYGARAVEKIVEPLAREGVTIVSGLALGIDALAHKAVLRTNGRTVAVLGNGIDWVYPHSHKYLAAEIIKNKGAIISEFPIGTPSHKSNFPFRNRIIAGMTLGTLVVEAALESGSLITAQVALNCNREVFAVPGEIFSGNSDGPNNLIKIGAKTVTCSEDILAELNIDSRVKESKAKEIIPDTKEEASILSILGKNPVHIDKIREMTKLDIIKINQTLTLMEMKGKVRNLGGNQYIIN